VTLGRSERRMEIAREPGGDRLEERAPRAVRWDVVLTWFMRAVAILWIFKGLGAWAVILGMDAQIPFEERSMGFQATMIYFAVIDPVAAVGLWLASAWGGVLWLLAVMSQLILTFFFPRVVTGGLLSTILFGLLILAYFLVSWMSTRDDPQN
jgi:hypothetical protein